MPNKHIKEFLDYYVDDEKLKNPKYAVLLKGKWGSGKTHFINEYKVHLDDISKKYIYVSLYGVKSYDEIETKFLKEIHPKLYNDKTIFAGKIAKGLLKGTLKLDLDDDGNDDGNVSVQIPNFKPEDLLNTKDRVLIFDDIERSSIDIVDLFGYINFFVEHQSYKVILIANEEEFKQIPKYKEKKEKLIGNTFEFRANIENAYESFLTELLNEKNVRTVLEKYKSDIFDIFNKSECNNLRKLRKSLLTFERFFNLVIYKHTSKENLINDILKYFFIFSLNKDFDFSQLIKLKDEYFDLLFEEEKEGLENTSYYIFINKYKLEREFNFILTIDLWIDIILNSIINKEEIDNQIHNSHYYFSKNVSSWEMLHRFHLLKDKEFEKLLEKIYYKLYYSEYKNFEEVKMISSLLLYFQDNKLFNISKISLDITIKKQIDYLFENDLVDDKIILPENSLEFDNSYKGFGYYDTDEFTKIKEYIDKKIEVKLNEKMKRDSLLILDALKDNNTNLLYDLLYLQSNKVVLYYDKPILQYLNTEQILDSIYKADNITLHHFGGILKKRYLSHHELDIEKEFLKNLNKKLKSTQGNLNMKLKNFHIKRELINTIEKIVGEK